MKLLAYKFCDAFRCACLFLLLPGLLHAESTEPDENTSDNIFSSAYNLVLAIWDDVHQKLIFEVFLQCLITGALAIGGFHLSLRLYKNEQRRKQIISYFLLLVSLILTALTMKSLVNLTLGDVAHWAPETVESWLKLSAAFFSITLVSILAKTLAAWLHTKECVNVARYYIILSVLALIFCLTQPFLNPTVKQAPEFYWLQAQIEIAQKGQFVKGTQEFQNEILKVFSTSLKRKTKN